MNSLSFVNTSVNPYVFSKTSNLKDLYTEKRQAEQNPKSLLAFLKAHPEMIGVEKTGRKLYEFSESQLREDLNTIDLINLDIEQEYIPLLKVVFDNRSNNECKEIIQFLLNREKWDVLEKIIHSLNYEKIKSLKNVTGLNLYRLKNANLNQISFVMRAFPSSDLKDIIYSWDSNECRNVLKEDFTQFQKPLLIYFHVVKGISIKGIDPIEERLRSLFKTFFSIFTCTAYKGIEPKLQQDIFDYVFSEYTICADEIKQGVLTKIF